MVTCPQCGAEVPANAKFCGACGEDLNPAIADSPDQGQMKKCYYCGKPFAGEDAYYFKCRYCEHDFCNEHRLPENHLCKSSPLRRNIPTTSMPYYSTSSGYYTSTGSPSNRGGFSLSLSKQGRNLIILIISGIAIGLVSSFVFVDNIQVLLFLVQDNYLVYHGWLPALATSMIVVAPNSLGLVDVLFNAVSVFFIDRLLTSYFTVRQYWLVFLLTGLAGNVVSLFGYGAGAGIVATTVSFGASGGIFGLVAGAVGADYAVNHKVNTALILWFVIIFVYSALGGSVDIYAHLGGALVGLPMGYYIGHKHRTERFR